MLQFNLKAVMSEQKKTITWLSDKTGISRKTLSQMVNNETKGIQFSTLEAVMSALNVEVDDLIARAPISAILSVLADDEVTSSSSLTIDDGKFFSTTIFLELIQLSGGKLEADEAADYYPVLGVSATVTNGGGMLITIGSPFVGKLSEHPDNEKFKLLVNNVDKFIGFLRICSYDTQEEISANVIAALLRRVKRGNGDISKLALDASTPVLWQPSQAGEGTLAIVDGSSYLPPEEHAIFKTNPDKEVSIVNGPLDSLKKR